MIARNRKNRQNVFLIEIREILARSGGIFRINNVDEILGNLFVSHALAPR